MSCGVCGGDISNVKSGNLESLQAKRQPSKPKTELHAKGIAILGAGLGIVVLGAYLLFASGVIGLFLLLIGVIVVASTVEIDGGWFGGLGGDWPSKLWERASKRRWDKERQNQERGIEE